MPYSPWFPEAGSYIKYRDTAVRDIRYRKLEWMTDPHKYPFRLPALAGGVKASSATSFDELNPSDTKKHIYLAYLGVCPGFLFYLYHPFDVKNLKWDTKIDGISEDLVANLTYEESPYEFPTKAIGIERDRYPALQAYNISGSTKTPQVIWIAALYQVLEQEDLSADELAKLQSGQIRAHPWWFGGEM